MTTLICDFQSIVGKKIDGVATLTAGKVRPAYDAPTVIVHEPIEQKVVNGRTTFRNVNPGAAVLTVDWEDQSATLRFDVPESTEDIYLADCLSGDYLLPEEIEMLRWGIREQISGARALIEASAELGLGEINGSIADYFSQAAETLRKALEAAERSENALGTIDNKVAATEGAVTDAAAAKETANGLLEELERLNREIADGKIDLGAAVGALNELSPQVADATEKVGAATKLAEKAVGDLIIVQEENSAEFGAIQESLGTAIEEAESATAGLATANQRISAEVQRILGEVEGSLDVARQGVTDARAANERIGTLQGVLQGIEGAQELIIHEQEAINATYEENLATLDAIQVDLEDATGNLSNLTEEYSTLTTDMTSKVSALQQLTNSQSTEINTAKEQAAKGIADAAAAKRVADQARTDATTKSAAAETAAKDYAKEAAEAAQAEAERVAAAEALRVAQAEANAAKSSAASDATTKVAAAEKALKIYTDAEAKAAKEAAEATAAQDASNKANQAKVDAEASAKVLSDKAQQAAVAAQSSIDNLEIGGRNHILNSSGPGTPLTILSNHSGDYPLTQGADETGAWLRGWHVAENIWFISAYINPTYSDGSGTYYSPDFLNLSGEYTQSFEVMCDVGIRVRISRGEDKTLVPGEWTRLTVTRNITSGATRPLGIEVGGNQPVEVPAETKLYHRHWKIEAGNKATEWTPAPEDAIAGIAKAQAEAETARAEATSKSDAARVAAELAAKEMAEQAQADAEVEAARAALEIAQREATAAKNAAATDATQKANAAQTAAENLAKAEAKAAKEAAEATAATDASAKANKAKTDAETKAAQLATAAQDAADKALTSYKGQNDPKVTKAQQDADKGISNAATALARANEANSKLPSITADVSAAAKSALEAVNAIPGIRTEITAAKQQADKGVTDAANAKSAVDNLQIGGRNLRRDSNSFSSYTTYSDAVRNEIKEGVAVPEWGATDATRMKYTRGTSDLATVPSYTYLPGETVTFSYWFKNIGTAPISILYNGLIPQVEVTYEPGFSGRITHTGRLRSSIDWFQHQIRFLPDAVDTGNTTMEFILWRSKLETGTKATDWTPAPEDVDSEIATAQTTADTARTEADTAKKRADKGVTDAADAKSAVDNLQIGGRNLLQNSKLNMTSSVYNMIVGTYGQTLMLPEDYPLVNGEEVTVSIKGQLGEDRDHFALYNSGGTYNIITLSSAHQGNDGVYRRTTTWKGEETSNSYVYIYQMYSDATSESTIEWVKIERGNKATDWSPAPEDVDAGITTAQSAAEGTARTLSSQALQDATTALTNYQKVNDPKVSTAQSAANTAKSAADTAKQQADKGVADAADAKSAVDNLQIGGRNIYRDSLGIRINGSDYRTKVTTTPIPGGSRIEVAEGGTWNAYTFMESQITDPEFFNRPGAQYTLSYDIRTGPLPGGYNVRARFDTRTPGGAIYSQDYETTGGTGEKWVRLRTTMVMPKRDPQLTSLLNLGPEGDVSSVPAGGIWFEVRNFKLERGNKATDWTPAPEDAQAEINALVNKADDLTTGLSKAATQEQYNQLNTKLWGGQGEINKLQSDINTNNSVFQAWQKTINDQQTKWNTASSNATVALARFAITQSQWNTLSSTASDANTKAIASHAALFEGQHKWNKVAADAVAAQATLLAKQDVWNEAQERVNTNFSRWQSAAQEMLDSTGRFQKLQTQFNSDQKKWNTTQTLVNDSQKGINALNNGVNDAQNTAIDALTQIVGDPDIVSNEGSLSYRVDKIEQSLPQELAIVRNDVSNKIGRIWEKHHWISPDTNLQGGAYFTVSRPRANRMLIEAKGTWLGRFTVVATTEAGLTLLDYRDVTSSARSWELSAPMSGAFDRATLDFSVSPGEAVNHTVPYGSAVLTSGDAWRVLSSHKVPSPTKINVALNVGWHAATHDYKYGIRIRSSSGTVLASDGPRTGVGPRSPFGNGYRTMGISRNGYTVSGGTTIYFEAYVLATGAGDAQRTLRDYTTHIDYIK